MHAGGVARDVDFCRPLFEDGRWVARRGRPRREIPVDWPAAFRDVVLVVIVIIVDKDFENPFWR